MPNEPLILPAQPARAGSTVLVPAGVPHTFGNAERPEVYRRYASELLE